jgi:Protein of unknown function (DUF3040)
MALPVVNAADAWWSVITATIFTEICGRNPMPLSEREQKSLDQIERGLRDEGPQFADVLRSAPDLSGIRRLAMPALAGIAVGMTLVLAGLIVRVVILAILGFLVIVAAVAYATTKLPELRPAEENELPLENRSRQ